jgi:hypothetical protein
LHPWAQPALNNWRHVFSSRRFPYRRVGILCTVQNDPNLLTKFRFF